MAAFATTADMLLRYDARTLGDLCSDVGTRIPEALLVSDPKLVALLDTATGQIKAAVLRGDRYKTVDLESLTGESREYLVDMTCRIAFWLLWQRKPYSDDQNRMEAKKGADEALELLRTGAHVFDVDTAIEAGKPYVETVTRTEIANNWNLVADRCRGRFFPARRTYANR
jgi:hypothetical protein